MKYLKRTYLVLSFLFIFPLSISCGEPTHRTQVSHEIFRTIERLSESADGYTADFTAQFLNEDGSVEVTQGSMKYKWPNMSKQELSYSQNDSKDIIVSNGIIEWMYLPHLKMALKYNLQAIDRDAQKKHGFHARYIDEETMNYVGKDFIDGEEVYVIEGYPTPLVRQRDDLHPEKGRVFLGVLDGLVRKVAFYDRNDQETQSQIFRNIKQDKSIRESDFEFEPPPGVRVVEVNNAGVTPLPVTVSSTKQK